MNRSIIAVYGKKEQGKSETIKELCKLILKKYPSAIPSETNISYRGDILLNIQIGSVKIGLESQGDPGSRILYNDTLRKLADAKKSKKLGGCDIIVCATRTSGATTRLVDTVANEYDYHTLWISSFMSPKLNHQFLNKRAAENILEIIEALIRGTL